MQHAMRTRHTVIYGLPRSTTFFPHYLNKQHDSARRGGGGVERFFSLRLAQTLLVLTGTERVWMYTGVNVKYPIFLSDF
jgi:hypothetical protein